MQTREAPGAKHGPSVPLRRRLVASLTSPWLGDGLMLAALTSAVVLVHLAIGGATPTGADPGNWLAIAQEMRGADVMSADVVYPPLFTGLLAVVLQLGVSPISGLLIMGLVAKLLLVLATYLTARTLGRGYAAVAAAAVAVAGAQMEAFAWGGYPQLLGMGFGLLAVFMVIRYLDTQEPSHLWVGLVMVAATLASHALIGSLLAAALAIGVVHWLFLVDALPRQWRQGLITGGAIAGGTALLALILFVFGVWSGGESTLNPQGLSRLEGLSHVFREAPVPWAIVAVVAVVVLSFRYWPEHVAATLAVGSAWGSAALVFFLVTGEARGLLVAQVGVILLATLGFGAFREYVTEPRGSRQSVIQPPSEWKYRSVTIFGVSILASVVLAGLGAYSSAADWYRLVEKPELAALDQLREQGVGPDLVVTSRGHRGMPIGWWVEGYGETPSYTGHDVSFLAFTDERQQAEVANAVFSGELSYAETSALLNEIGANYLVVDRRGPDADWLQDPYARSLPVVAGSSSLVILQVRSGG